jgi:hypothetical protein
VKDSILAACPSVVKEADVFNKILQMNDSDLAEMNPKFHASLILMKSESDNLREFHSCESIHS